MYVFFFFFRMVPSNTCYICEKTFAMNSGLKRHLREVHNIFKHEETLRRRTNAYNYFKCVICSECCTNYKHFSNHVSNKHNIYIKKESFEFKSAEDFFNWKNQIEDEENCYFSKQRTYKTPSKNSQTEWFGCNRSGFYKSRVTERKKKIKFQGSAKISGYCPAGIKATCKDDGSISVQYTSTHVGHSSELAHLRLKFEQRKNIAKKIAMNIPFDDILEEIRSSTQNSEIKREHLITRRDLHNIKKEFSLRNKKSVHNHNDSNDSWVEEESVTEKKCTGHDLYKIKNVFSLRNKKTVHDLKDSIDQWVEEESVTDNNCIMVYQPEENVISEEYPMFKVEDVAVEIIIEDNDSGENAVILQDLESDVDIGSIDVQKQLFRDQIESILNNVSTAEEIQVLNDTIENLVPRLNALKEDNVEHANVNGKSDEPSVKNNKCNRRSFRSPTKLKKTINTISPVNKGADEEFIELDVDALIDQPSDSTS